MFGKINPGILTTKSAKVLNELARAVEQHESLLVPRDQNNPVYERFPAKITAVDGSGNYTWTEQFYTSAGVYEDKTNGRSGSPSNQPAKERNGATLYTFPQYAVLQSRVVVDGVFIYEFDASAATFSLGVLADTVDGSPSYSATRTLRFDEADGFSLSQPSANVARVDMLPATASQAGIVSTVLQVLAGVKSFVDGINLPGTTANFHWIAGDGSTGTDGHMYLLDDVSGVVVFDLDMTSGNGIAEWVCDEIKLSKGQGGSYNHITASVVTNRITIEEPAGSFMTLDESNTSGRSRWMFTNANSDAVLAQLTITGTGGSSTGVLYLNPTGGDGNTNTTAYGIGMGGLNHVGQTGTSGGGDTVKGGIITTLGSSLADQLDALGGITGTYGG